MNLPQEYQKPKVDVPAEFVEVFDLKDNLEGVVPRLLQISIAHQAQMFKMPDGARIEKFEAVILDQQPANAWWEVPITEGGGGNIPDCWSPDGIKPNPQSEKPQATICAQCGHNEYGSDKRGRGKACKNMKRLHLLMEDSLLPRRLTVPPTSIKATDTFFTTLIDQGLPYRALVVEISLKAIVNEFEYSELVYEKVRILSQDELKVVGTLVRKLKEGMRGQEVRPEEYQSAEQKEKEEDIPF